MTSAPVPPLPQLFSDRIAKGWEFELHLNLNPQTSIVGNITNNAALVFNRSDNIAYGGVISGTGDQKEFALFADVLGFGLN